MKFNIVVCGGTFDHFHKGHEAFLRYVFSVGKKIIVGVTSDQYVRSSKLETGSLKEIESFEQRKQAVLKFVKKEGVLEKVEIVEINDLFGPTLSKELTIDVIVVSESTKKGAELINERRKKLGFKELNLLIVPQVLAMDGKIISSRRIRNGEINRKGQPYVNPLWFEKDLMLPENLRKEFQKPFGELFKDVNDSFKNRNYLVITVGDITTKIFNENSLGQNISVIDFKVNREKKFANIKELGFIGSEHIFHADNPAGYISSNLFKKLSEIFQLRAKHKIVLQVNGEEDLAVLPLVLLSSLNTVIYYGQPGQGVVKVIVSEESKKVAYGLVKRFEIPKQVRNDR